VNILQKGSLMSNMETSRDALASIEPSLPTITEQVYQYIFSRGEDGVTDDAGYRALQMNPNTYRPSRVGLMESGLVVNTNLKGRTQSGREAWLWRAIPKDQAVPPTNLKKRKSKKLPKINPPQFPEGFDVGLREAQSRIVNKLSVADEATCPCCGVRVTKG
jgi:hypothetical protein